MIHLIEKLKRSVSLIIGRAVIRSIKSDNGLKADIALIAGEKHSGVPFFQHYGITSKPNKDSEAVVLFIGGSRDNGICIASQGDPSKIPSVEDGEVCLFSEFGQKILLKKDGSIVLTPKSGQKYRIESDVEVTGDLKVFCDGAFITMKNHIHPTPVGASSAPTPGI